MAYIMCQDVYMPHFLNVQGLPKMPVDLRTLCDDPRPIARAVPYIESTKHKYIVGTMITMIEPHVT